MSISFANVPPPRGAVVGFAAADRPGVRAMLAALNRARAAGGLGPLVLDRRLSGVAEAHARDMLGRGRFGHDVSQGDPFARMRAAGLSFVYAGENLALAPSEPLAERALERSPEHRANILEQHYVRVGIAAVSVPGTGELFVQEFTD